MYGWLSILLVILMPGCWSRRKMFEQKFSRYEIREELGIGGMATVHRAYDPLFEREVAVKVLKRELLEDTPLRDRFERETKIIARLEHAAIVPVYDVGHDNRQMFYVMRYMSGGSLSERIQNGALTLNQVAHILMRMADALDYAHRKGIVHRDLKPGNILFDEVNNAFISDFGIAKIAEAATRITNSGIIGTPRYMSPEQARGDEADGRSDQYSLAVILFEILSGKAPFEATTPLALAFKHATEPAPDILDINPKLPPDLGRVLRKALEKEPDKRYNTCIEFARAFLDSFPDSAEFDIGSVTPLPPHIYRNVESPTRLPTEPVGKPRTGLRAWMIGGFIAVTLLGFAAWGFPQFTAQTDAPTSTPEPVTATVAPATPTQSLMETVTPTEVVEPTALPIVPVDPGIGGALRIALTANRDIYLMDVDGRNIRQLTNTNLPKFDLQWLPGNRELLYGEGRCIYKIDTESPEANPEKITCLDGEHFEGFRVSPDGANVAVGIERRLIVLPFDQQELSTVTSGFELQNMDDVCLVYAEVAVKGAQWSDDGNSLAILYQSVVGQRLGDTLRVMDIDLNRCRAVDPLIRDEFPGRRFIPEGYETYPLIPSYHWDGNQRFVFNTFKRNGGYGELYLYDMSTAEGIRINPVNGICCYRGGTISPDGTHLLFAFQDIRQGAESDTQVYYIPMDQIDAGTRFTPIKLPLRFFPNPREEVLFALQSSAR